MAGPGRAVFAGHDVNPWTASRCRQPAGSGWLILPISLPWQR